jgi:tetratricopeptide (TPR) repeat protein
MASSHNDEQEETRSFRVLTPGTMISRYRILGKIGQGGMGVVYRAEDTRLGRTIALKFLPSHLLCDSEALERFEHEARAASALSHPNIATIHEIDEADGRCFIAMEYLDGGSLKEHIRQKDLPIKEILDLVIQIGEGLAAAHERGVVHRDMKPDNIMLTQKGLPKITDFGLAKLRGATKVTKTGTTLGTLQYMSPEQASGREVDQRSDIFSLGVILYEMIAGRLPFHGENEAAVINAILNETPEPLARYKSDVPEGVERIVRRALEKDVSERYQHADDLVAEFRHERRMLETGATAGALTGALTGAPTGQRVRGGGSGASRAGAASDRVSGAAAPRRTRRLLSIVIPAAVVVLVAVAIIILEPFRREAGPGSEATAMENSLAIMYFENMVDAEDTDKTAQMITALLITDLSESDYMYVISRQRLYDILKLLGKEDLRVIDRTVASEVAKRAGAKWILTGSILQAEPGLVLTADISDASTGRVLATQRVKGDPDEDLFTVVDRLSVAVKQDLVLPDAARSELDPSVADVTTHSAEAYRYYLEGVDYEERLYRLDAIESFTRAIECDTTFAMAYYRLARFYPSATGRDLAAKAVEHVDHAGDRDRYLIEALHAGFSGEVDRSVQILTEAVRKYPDDKTIRFELALFYGNDRQHLDRTIEQLEAAIEIDPLFAAAYNQLAYAYDRVGEFERSIWAVSNYISVAPDEPNPYDTQGDLYARNGKINEAIDSYRKAIAVDPDFLESVRKLGHLYVFLGDYEAADACYRQTFSSTDVQERSRGRICLAFIPAYRGRFEEALAVLDDGITADRMDQYEGMYRAEKHRLKSEIHRMRGERELAVGEARASDELAGRLSTHRQMRYRPHLVLALAEMGEFEEAERFARELEGEMMLSESADLEYKWITAALIAMARGDDRAAISSFERAREYDPALVCELRVMLGQCYLDEGMLADAVSELEETLSRYEGERVSAPTYSVRAHYLLGLAYERSGWSDRAAGQYETFLEIWKDADPGIAEIDDARERLTRLRTPAS